MSSGRSFAIGILTGVVFFVIASGFFDLDYGAQKRSLAKPFERTFATSWRNFGFGVSLETIGSEFSFVPYNNESGTNSTEAIAVVGGTTHGLRIAPKTYPNTTGPLMLFDPLPFPEHPPNNGNQFLVAIGIMSMDSDFGASRRRLIRSSWMTYKDVWAPLAKRKDTSSPPSMLVKFVVGRHHKNGYTFTKQLEEEANNVEAFYDIVAVSLLERQSSSGKHNSTKYGIWGLESMLSTELKSFIWRRIALAKYAASFIAKADDDIFLVVPNYIATLRVLPRLNCSWGYHSLVERVPGHRDTTFPYNVGPIATASADIANVMATSPVLSFLSEPFTGRPADYFIRRCDHEDYGTYSSIDEVKTPFHVFHDCRFVEPYIHGKEFFRPPPLEANGIVDSSAVPYAPTRLDRRFFVNFHKLEPDLFSRAMEWFPDDGNLELISPPPNFTSVRIKGIPPRVGVHLTTEAMHQRCGPMTKVNYHTYWKELGAMRFRLTDNTHDYVAECSYQDLRGVTTPFVLALGILDRHAENRVRFRAQMNGAPDLWSWWNRSHPVLVRFPIFFSGKGVSRKQFWECHRYQDMISIPKSVLPFETRASLHAFLWLRKARKLYPTAAFIGTMYGIPKLWNPFFLPSYFASLLNRTVPQTHRLLSKPSGSTEHIIIHNYLGVADGGIGSSSEHQKDGTELVTKKKKSRSESGSNGANKMNKLAFTIVSSSIAWTIPFSFPLAASSFTINGALRKSKVAKKKAAHPLALFNALIYKSAAANQITEKKPTDLMNAAVLRTDDDGPSDESPNVNATADEMSTPPENSSPRPFATTAAPAFVVSMCVCNRAALLPPNSAARFKSALRLPVDDTVGSRLLPEPPLGNTSRAFIVACDDEVSDDPTSLSVPLTAVRPHAGDTCWF
jgi:hypothetical protein